MNITVESYGHAVLLNVKGELTEDSLSVFQKEVDRQLGGKDVVDVVLNMESVPFIDSTALEYLLDLQDKLEQKFGQVKLTKVDQHIRKILEVTRLVSQFEVYNDVSEAVKATQA